MPFLIEKRENLDYTKNVNEHLFGYKNERRNDNLTKKLVNLTHYSSEEILAAAGQFDTLYEGSIEAPSQYLERKRNRDMQKLVGFVVQNELEGIRREIFMKAYFFGEKFSDIAEETGINARNVYKHYEKALKTIREALKYVRFYQSGCNKERMKPLETMRNDAYIAVKNPFAPAMIMRLSRLMEKENVAEESLCRCLDLDKEHFEKIFCGRALPDAEEIVKFAGFFGVSTDYILKGDLS